MNISHKVRYGRDGEHWTKYLSVFQMGQLRVNVFHRGDADPDPHDHPWDFWTFPLTSYSEKVWQADGSMEWNLVKAFRLHYRPAEHRHLVCSRVMKYGWRSHLLGVFDNMSYMDPGMEIHQSKGRCWYGWNGFRPIVTIVWCEPKRRNWGFWTLTNIVELGGAFRRSFMPWKRYIYERAQKAD